MVGSVTYNRNCLQRRYLVGFERDRSNRSLTVGSVITTGTLYSDLPRQPVNEFVQSSLTVGSVITTGTVYSSYLSALNGSIQSSLTVGSVLTTGTLYSTYLTAVNEFVQSSLTVGSVITTGTVYSSYLSALNGSIQSSLISRFGVNNRDRLYSTYLTVSQRVRTVGSDGWLGNHDRDRERDLSFSHQRGRTVESDGRLGDHYRNRIWKLSLGV